MYSVAGREGFVWSRIQYEIVCIQKRVNKTQTEQLFIYYLFQYTQKLNTYYFNSCLPLSKAKLKLILTFFFIVNKYGQTKRKFLLQFIIDQNLKKILLWGCVRYLCLYVFGNLQNIYRI